jgi:hypothetical protein
MIQAPEVDRRRSHEIARDVRSLLPVYVENWPGQQAGELAEALIHVFARFGELIVDRLNKTPEKNFLAFLDLIGISPLPLQAARAPVTFYLAAGAAGYAVVRAGTQVAAPPGPGEQKPVIFETEKELVVVSASLASLIVKDGGHDQFTDFSAILAPASPLPGTAQEATVPATGGVTVIPHVLCIPLPVYPVWPELTGIRLKVALDTDLPDPIDPRMLQWELCVAAYPASTTPAPVAGQVQDDVAVKTIAVEPSKDETENLTRSGDVLFFNLPDIPFVALDDLPGHWLRCRLLTPIACSSESSVGMVREKQLPSIKSLAIETLMDRSGLPIEQGFFNSQKLDLTKEFFPFGEKPKFGDTLYLASREAFSNPDAVLTFHVVLTNPSGGPDVPLPAVKPQGTKLSWEFWDGKMWAELGTAEIGALRIRIGSDNPGASDAQFSDDTQVFSRSGDISFKFHRPPAQLNLNGQNNYWIRVRIIAGDYGKEAHFDHAAGGLLERELTKGGFAFTPATFTPPSIRSIKVDYAVKKESQPAAVLAYNDFAYTKIDPRSGPFQPFVPVSPDQLLPSLYFGFSLPAPPAASATASSRLFPTCAMTVYVGTTPRIAGQEPGPTPGFAAANWEYWNGAAWTKWIVLDDTQGIRRSGLIRFLGPSDFALGRQFGRSRYWLRMRQDDPEFLPGFSHVLLNTTMAVQGATIANEILGASNETPGQQFRTIQAPVLTGQKLEVREPLQPSWQERAQIEADEGEDAIAQVAEPTGGDAFWVCWTEVPNFYGSGPRDRHYLLDRMIGELTFGDGTNGMVPPALPGNMRISYRAGGGSAGNKPAGAIAQLKSAIPYVQKASNSEASSGGTDPEPYSALLDRGPLDIRHGGRAVTREDFENLATLASREVARAKCVPLFDLAQDPNATSRRPGMVSLIVVPRSTDVRPRPSQDLFDRVRSYLDAHRHLTAALVLAVPEYVRVDVDCEIAVSEIETAGEVAQAAKMALECYLHPVTGGGDGAGWDFGREPQRSDFFGLLESIAGVSHVRELRVSLTPDRPGSEKTGRFLICSGSHKVAITLEE